MAPRVRAQLLSACAALACAACDASPGESRPGTAPTPAVGADDRGAAEVVEAILTRCHGQRRGTLARSRLELRDAPGAAPLSVFTDLPRRLRVDTQGGERLLLDGDAAFAWHPSDDEARPAPTRLVELSTLRDALAAVFLLPLEEARAPWRIGPAAIAWRGADGGEWQLEYDPSTDTPRSIGPIAGPARVVFETHYDSGVTRIPERIRIDTLGPRWLTVLDAGLVYASDTFALQRSGERSVAGVLGAGGALVFPGTTTPGPAIVTRDAGERLVVPDPGAWSSRWDVLVDLGSRLHAGGYASSEDPYLFEVDGERWLSIPVAKSGESALRPFVPGGRERLEREPAQRVVSADLPAADYATRLATARAAIDRFVTDNGLEIAGPERIVVNPRVDFRVFDRDATRLDTADLRMQVPIR